jgi:hypothetical protein
MWIQALCLALSLASQERAPVGFEALALPQGWSIVATERADPGGLERFSAQLGTPLKALANQVLDVGGLRLQVNFLLAADEAGAKELERSLRAGRAPALVRRRGAELIEFAKMNAVAAAALGQALGLEAPPPQAWKAEFWLAPVSAAPAADCNRAFNLCLALEKQPGDAALARELADLTRGWEFGQELRLRAPGPGFAARYQFTPKPLEQRQEGELWIVRFGELPRRHGFPAVRVTVEGTQAERFVPSAAPAPSLPEARAWRSDAATRLAAELTAGLEDAAARFAAIQAHVYTGIRFAGDRSGSRYGVDQVLSQGYGHCWDKSDVAIALCRAAGLPARQVAGWVPALGAGHVWCEVYLDGGWLPFDATCPWPGTSIDYLPWFLSEDGELEFLYLSLPQIELLRAEAPETAPRAPQR